MRRVSAASLLCVLAFSLSGAASAEEERIQVDCARFVTPENHNLGFSAVQDDRCLTNNAECFQHTCRLCKHTENEHTKFYRACNGINSQPDLATAPAGTASSSHSKLKALEAATEAVALTSADCAARVSSGDQNVGISALLDASCVSGGVGCFGTDFCKYCRTTTTTQSEHYGLCSELSGGASTTTSLTISTASASTSTSASSCASAASSSGLQNVDAVTETRCKTSTHLAGCVAATSCRLCRNAKNEGNQFLVSCKVLRELQQQLITTTAVSTASESSERDTSQGLSSPAMMGVSAAAGFALALAAVAIKNSRTRRVADSSGDHLQRIDSILHVVGRDRIAQL